MVPYLKIRFHLAPGAGYLTDRRFLRTNNLRATLGGLVGTLFKGTVDIDFPLESIARISRSKHLGVYSVLKIESTKR